MLERSPNSLGDYPGWKMSGSDLMVQHDASTNIMEIGIMSTTILQEKSDIDG